MGEGSCCGGGCGGAGRYGGAGLGRGRRAGAMGRAGRRVMIGTMGREGGQKAPTAVGGRPAPRPLRLGGLAVPPLVRPNGTGVLLHTAKAAGAA
jgi:hypothetical protein